MFALFMLTITSDRLVGALAEAGQPTTALTVFANPLGTRFLMIVVLLLVAAVMAMAVGCVFKLGLKSSWKTTLITAGSAFGGTFLIGFMIISYLMPPATG